MAYILSLAKPHIWIEIENHVHALRLRDTGHATVVHLLYGLEDGEASCNEFVVLKYGSYLAFDTVAGVSSRLTVNQLG